MAKIEVGFLQLGTGDVSFGFWNSIKFPAPRLENKRRKL
jgi:hypothetical protein